MKHVIRLDYWSDRIIRENDKKEIKKLKILSKQNGLLSHPLQVEHVEQAAPSRWVLERVTCRVFFFLLFFLTRHQNVAEFHFGFELFELLEEVGLVLLSWQWFWGGLRYLLSWLQDLLVHVFLIPPDMFYQVDGHHIFVRKLIWVTVKIITESLFLLMVLFELNHFPRRLGPQSIRAQYERLLIDKPPLWKPHMLAGAIGHSLQVNRERELAATGMLTDILIDDLDNMLFVKGRKLLSVNALKPFLMLVSLH